MQTNEPDRSDFYHAVYIYFGKNSSYLYFSKNSISPYIIFHVHCAHIPYLGHKKFNMAPLQGLSIDRYKRTSRTFWVNVENVENVQKVQRVESVQSVRIVRDKRGKTWET